MQVLKRSGRTAPKVSFVLLDWSVRESFHLLNYLADQTVERDEFEVIVIEYYSRRSQALQPFLSEVDTWALLEMPEACYYHKHLMYNVGITMARGDILVFCDSDAMVRPTFVQTIVDAFEDRPELVLHLDQFRNSRRDFYPFNYPSFDDVLGRGCINNVGGRTRGLASLDDPLHERNYGACMCARRADLIAIGGADEHLDYLGHICGPYDMTFRLANLGRREFWHSSEFLFHTWHPGQAGVDNYLGPHDGRHMSTTALDCLVTGRVQPYVANPAVIALQQGGVEGPLREAEMIAADRAALWVLQGRTPQDIERIADETRTLFDYRGFRVARENGRYQARLIVDWRQATGGSFALEGDTSRDIRARIDRSITATPRLASAAGSLWVLATRTGAALRVLVRPAVVGARRLPRLARRAAGYVLRTTIRRVRWLGIEGRLIAARVWTASRRAAGRSLRAARRLPRRSARLARRVIMRTADRGRRFFLERTRMSGSLGSVIVNLHFLRVPPGSDGAGVPMLVTEQSGVAYYVRGLSRLGVIPKMDVVRLRSGDVPGWVARRSRERGGPPLLVGRDMYVKHHAAFAASGVGDRVTVL